MATSARVQSIDALKAFRRALFKFAESANVAMTDAESEVTRLLMWVQLEQQTFWQGQIKKRTDLVARCEEAVRMKKLFADAAGRRSSAIDEIKALEKAKKALEEAHTKFAACKTWSRKLEKLAQDYKGVVQRLATNVQSQLPVAAAKLEAGILKLEEYVAMGAPTEQVSATPIGSEPGVGAAGAEALPSMARPEAEPEPEAKPEPEPAPKPENAADSDAAKPSDA
jgi:hypothetical protein